MIINYYNSTSGKIKSVLESRHPKLLEKNLLPLGLFLYDRYHYKKIDKRVKGYYKEDTYPLFSSIEIETINRCNGSCSFCPINKNLDPRSYSKMSSEMFESIINQLEKLNFEGNIGLYSNNEPLLDDRIFSFARLAREKLPNAKIYLFTNGSLLTIEKFELLIPYLDRLIIDNYNDKLLLNEPVKRVYKYIENSARIYKDKVKIFIRKENEILLNRGGEAKNRTKNPFKLRSACIYPFEQFIIRPDGKVSLCCNDPLGKVTMGDLEKNTISEVWYGDRYTSLRELIKNGRDYHPMCSNCDAVTPDMFLDNLA